MKRVLLIAPPFYRLMGSHYNGLHLGIAYIAAVLKKHGHTVGVYNADYFRTDEYLNQRQLFENFPSYKEILNDRTHPIWEEIKDKIAGFMPDIVGIAMMTPNYKAARSIAGITKKLDSHIKVVVGGAHATLDPEDTIVEAEFDYVIRGEGELPFLELAEGQREEKIKGLSYKKNGGIVHNDDRPFIKDLDPLPFPCRDSFLNDTEYTDYGNIITGRGCTFACSYCASPRLWHRTVRFRSVPNVISELELLAKDFKSSLIHFADDTFTLNRKRAKDICRQIIERKLGIKWVCDTRVDCLDKELMTLMNKAGCVRVKIGVESGSNRILKAINKGTNREKIRQAVRLIKDAGLPLTIYLMAGFPGETDDDLRQTIEFARELEPNYVSLSVLAPYYGTQIWRDLEKSGKKIDREHWEYFYHQSQDMIINHGLDPELLNEFFALDELGDGRV